MLRNELAAAAMACLVAGCGIEGLHGANPKTVVRVDPVNRTVEYYDSKDNDLQIDGLAIDGATKSATLDKLTLRNNASDVRLANYQQMVGYAAQASANWQGAAQTVGALAGVLREIAPYLPPLAAARALGAIRSLSVSTPWGGANYGGADAAQLAVLEQMLERQAATAPASQPGG